MLLLVVRVTGQQPSTPPTASSVAAAQEAPFSNADVVKLSKLDLGNEVVIAKVNQAKAVDFRLDTDGLVALKQEGVSKEVIAAMLNRTSAPQVQKAPATGSSAYAGMPGLNTSQIAGDEGVLVRTAQGEKRLQSVQGDISTTFIYVATLMFVDFPGLKADIKITDRKPTLIVRSNKSPRGRVFLVKCDSNEKDNNRSVKVGRSGLFTKKSWSSPDKDWTVDFDIKETTDGLWEIRPKADLESGEYGVLFRGGFLGLLSGTQAEIFDFGVE